MATGNSSRSLGGNKELGPLFPRTKVRCRNVIGGLYVATGVVIAKDDRWVVVQHQVSSVDESLVIRSYSRETGSWECPPGSKRKISRVSYITKADLARLVAQ